MQQWEDCKKKIPQEGDHMIHTRKERRDNQKIDSARKPQYEKFDQVELPIRVELEGQKLLTCDGAQITKTGPTTS